MRTVIFILSIVSVGFISSCKKTYDCECVEFYNGADTSWTKVKGNRDFEFRKEKNAVIECDKLDGTTQVFGTEEYGLNCELK